MYPSDVVKTRSQLRSIPTGFFSDMFYIFKQGVAYRGVATLLTCDPLKRSLKFGVYQEYSRLLRTECWCDGPTPSPSWQRDGVAGAMAGMTETLFECPFENVKVRMQIQSLAYVNSWECLWSILRHESPLCLYRGLSAHLMRNAVWNCCFFGTAGLRKFYSHKLGKEASAPVQTAINFVCGASGGALGVMLNTPFDVVKTRMQDCTQKVPYNGISPSLRRIATEEGVSALYKGIKPRVFRLGLGGGVMIVAYDAVHDFLCQITEE